MEAIEITEFDNNDCTYTRNGHVYTSIDLIRAAEGLEEFDMPLHGLDLSYCWQIENMDDFLHHHNRVKGANLRFAIIFDDEGTVCDGLHRIAKAILEGKATIKAKRLTSMPEPIRIEKE